MTKVQILKENLKWGLVLWLIGWVLGIIFFMVFPKNIMGWVITPIGTAITIWVLVKKINRDILLCYFGVGVIWTVMAVALDYLFIVLLFGTGASYYKLDVFVYYLLTLALPIIVGYIKLRGKKVEKTI